MKRVPTAALSVRHVTRLHTSPWCRVVAQWFLSTFRVSNTMLNVISLELIPTFLERNYRLQYSWGCRQIGQTGAFWSDGTHVSHYVYFIISDWLVLKAMKVIHASVIVELTASPHSENSTGATLYAPSYSCNHVAISDSSTSMLSSSEPTAKIHLLSRTVLLLSRRLKSTKKDWCKERMVVATVSRLVMLTYSRSWC